MTEKRVCSCGNSFDGDNLCMVSACQWEGTEEEGRAQPMQVWSARIRWDEKNGATSEGRLGPYFSIQSARSQASRAKGKGATVLGIDTGTVTWEPTNG